MGQRAVVLMPRGTHVSERHPITSGGWLHGLHSSEEGVERTLWFYAGMPEELFEKAPVNCRPLLNSVRRGRWYGGIGRPSPRLGSSASETAFTHLQRFPCDARRSRIGRRNNTTMLIELTKLAVASTAATVVVWLLSLIHSGCVPDHVGDLIRFAAC